MSCQRLHSILDVSQISRLVGIGADVNMRDVDGGTALHASRSSAVARTLIEHGAVVNARNSRGMSALHRVKNVGVAKVLLERGALVNAIDTYGNTPLHYSNDVEVVHLLLKHGGRASSRNSKGETPIHMSTYGSKVLALAKVGADVDSADNTGKTLLMKKSRCFYVSNLFNSILELNPSDRLTDVDGKTAIDFAIDETVKRRLLSYRKEQNWRRRRALVLFKESFRESKRGYIAKDGLVLRTVCLTDGIFRSIVAYL